MLPEILTKTTSGDYEKGFREASLACKILSANGRTDLKAALGVSNQDYPGVKAWATERLLQASVRLAVAEGLMDDEQKKLYEERCEAAFDGLLIEAKKLAEAKK